MKTIQEIAKALNDEQLKYGDQIPKGIIEQARANRILIIYGASDDLIEFDGAFRDEAGAGSRPVFFTASGHLPEMEQVKQAILTIEDQTGVKVEIPQLLSVRPHWCKKMPDGRQPSWHYTTDLPHEEFTIMEDGEFYCVGIVVQLPDTEDATAKALAAEKLLEDMKKIARILNLDDPDSYVCDDREGAIDTAFGTARAAIAKAEGRATA